MLTENLARVPIAFLPTPVVEMRRLSEAVGGLRILAKRDDQTGLAMGGNKARKLEFLIADALARGADTVLTVAARSPTTSARPRQRPTCMGSGRC